MKLLPAILLLSLSVLLAGCGPTKPKPSAGGSHFLWKVSDGESHVWILGSIHFADSSFYPLPSAITKAFAESEELAVEINVSDDSVSSAITENSINKGMLPDDERLPEKISPETWRKLDSLCAVWNFPSSMLLKMRPWFAAMTLSAVAIQRSGIDPSFGVDAVLLDSAAMRGMPIVGLETAEEQVGALADTSDGDSLGIYYLESTLREISELDSMVARITRAWKTGDDSLMVQVLKSSSQNSEKATARDSLFEKESEDRIYKTRNQKMAQGIGQFIKEKRKVFVVVGAAHLVLDETNVIELLRREGFKVERF